MDIINLSTIRQTFANTVFTHQVQEAATQNQEGKAYIVKWINLVFVVLVLFLLVLQASNPENLIYSYFGILLSVFEISFMIFQLNFRFENRMMLHKNSALKFMGLRDNYRNLIADVMGSKIKIEDIRIRRDALQKEYQTICEFAPQTGISEYQKAQKNLNKRGVVEGENFTWSDEEIDHFLPEKLRLIKK